MGNPLREGLDLAEPFGAALFGKALPKPADQILGRAVMIGEVPAGKAGIVIGEHRRDRAFRINRAMRPRDLPHPIQHPADVESGRELKPACRGQRHLDLLARFFLSRIAWPLQKPLTGWMTGCASFETAASRPPQDEKIL